MNIAGDDIVRVPLDYYRILGLPIQATAEQLQQAHRDRTHQLPRREFSEAAIASRNSLVDQAYAVLSDTDYRQDYDATLLAKSYDLLEMEQEFDAAREAGDHAGNLGNELNNGFASPDSGIEDELYIPTVEILDAQFVGAMLILLEMGEYELVLRLGRPHLSGADPKLDRGDFGDPQIVVADVVLTVTLACLELGREQWQQGQYENAAESLEVGQSLLLREGVFANIRGEIQADLYKLRPYRVLELLALSENRDSERRQGITLLESMLQERGGIDGNGDDQSGLNMDDFLRFVQQIRSYLTSSEQQVIFEYESRRPSPVATYLAVYALIARGFAQRQPVLIRRAKSMLGRLGIRQDVHLEQSICALLLGQTEEANRVLDLSREYDSLSFIRENSQDSPDLLPGLCLYTERWLQDEVFPHFRDLSQKRASLKDYFADEDVQSYLEALPNETPDNQWSTATAIYTPIGSELAATQAVPPVSDFPETVYTPSGTLHPPTEGRSPYATESANFDSAAAYTVGDGAARSTMPDTSPILTTGAGSSSPAINGYGTPTGFAPPQSVPYAVSAEAPIPGKAAMGTTAAVKRGHLAFRWDRLLLLLGLAAASILLLMLLLTLLSRLFRGGSAPSPSPSEITTPRSNPSPNSSSGSSSADPVANPTVNPPNPQSSQQPGQSNSSGTTSSTLVKRLGVPLARLTEPKSITSVTSETLTLEGARTLIQNWLIAKGAAMGEAHAIDKLPEVLIGGALSQWQYWANEAKERNSPLRYEHSSLEITAVNVDANDPDTGTIEASVIEKQQSASVSSATTEDLRIRYTVIRENGEWKIQSIEPF